MKAQTLKVKDIHKIRINQSTQNLIKILARQYGQIFISNDLTFLYNDTNLNNYNTGSGEMAQWSQTSTALSEDPFLVSALKAGSS